MTDDIDKQKNDSKNPKDGVDYKKIANDTVIDIHKLFLEIKSFFIQILYIKDEDLIDVVFATVVSKAFPDEPVWLGIIGTPSSGKTEIIRSFGEKPTAYVYPTSKLTENALASGSDSTMPILAMELDGKLWTIKDLTTLISARPERAATIISIIREMYDGYLNVNSGMKGSTAKSGKTRTTLIFGVTPIIDNKRIFKSSLGERIIYFRIPYLSDEDEEKYLEKIMNSFFEDTKKRDIISKKVEKFMELINKLEVCVYNIEGFGSRISPDKELYKFVYKLSNMVTTMRIEFEWDYKKQDIEEVSDKEAEARILKQFIKLAFCLKIIRRKEKIGNEEKTTILKMGMHTIPRKLMIPLIKFIRNYNTTKENYLIDNSDILTYMINEHNISGKTAERRLSELELIKVIKCTYENNKKSWQFHPKFYNKFKELFDYLKDVPEYRNYNVINIPGSEHNPDNNIVNIIDTNTNSSADTSNINIKNFLDKNLESDEKKGSTT